MPTPKQLTTNNLIQTLKTFSFNNSLPTSKTSIKHKSQTNYIGKFESSKVERSKTSFQIRLNNQRKDIRNPIAIEVCQHFNNGNHAFRKHGKFILIEQLNNIKKHQRRF